MRLLIVEDDELLAHSLSRALTEQNYEVKVAPDGAKALEMARTETFQLIILDLLMPHLDGLQVVHRLRSVPDLTPVLFLTAMNRKGLEAGADDSLVKPFALAELLARIEAILRRSQPGDPPAESLEELEQLTFSHQSVLGSGRIVELSPQEFRILSLLAETPGRLVSRAELRQKVWGVFFDCETNVGDAAIRRLRQKLDAPFPDKLIQTVRGAGYWLGRG